MALEQLHSCTIVDEVENAMHFIQYSRMELAASLNPSTFENNHGDCTDENYQNANVSVSFDMDSEAEMHSNGSEHIVQSKATCNNPVSNGTYHLHEIESCYYSENQFKLQLKN